MRIARSLAISFLLGWAAPAGAAVPSTEAPANAVDKAPARPARFRKSRREESAACSEQVVYPAFGKSATLPPGEEVAVDLLPEEPGEYEFTCAMGMLRGKLVVVPPGEAAT